MQRGEDLGTDTPFVMLLPVAVLPAAVVSSGPAVPADRWQQCCRFALGRIWIFFFCIHLSAQGIILHRSEGKVVVCHNFCHTGTRFVRMGLLPLQ